MEINMVSSKKTKRSVQVKIILSVVFWFFTLILIAVIISFSRQLSNLQSQKSHILTQIDNTLSILNDGELLQQSNYKYLEDTFKKDIGQKYLYDLEKSYWKYTLEINGQEVTDGPITVNAGTVTITLREIEKERVLPDRLHMRGSITGFDANDHYYKHIITSSLGKEVTEQNLNQDTLEKYSTFTFKASSGEILRFNITEILAERLNLESKYITIKVK